MNEAIDSAIELLSTSVMTYRGEPIGTVAAMDPDDAVTVNYHDCFIRDFIPSALVFMADGNDRIVRNFLLAVLELRGQHICIQGHELEPAILPASFRVVHDSETGESIRADFGDQAIGRVAPVDAMMWWVILLGIYQRLSGDRALAQEVPVQRALCGILDLSLREGFEVFPTLLVPDGCCMIDRRMGVYGHPLEIQALFYAMMITALDLLEVCPENRARMELATERSTALRSYLRLFYWMDRNQLETICGYDTEQYGSSSVNMFNIYPDSIPDWVAEWLPERAGYLVGNLGPGRMDFRFFALGNLLSILFGITTHDEASSIMYLYSDRWADLIGEMPCKLVYPPVSGNEWMLVTGSDPKNVPWSYHNGGNWPVLLWAFVAAALKTGREDLARRALDTAGPTLLKDRWPEYYDGRQGSAIGQRANIGQVWTAAGYLFAQKLLKDKRLLQVFPQGSDG